MGWFLENPNHGYFYNQHSHRLMLISLHTCCLSLPFIRDNKSSVKWTHTGYSMKVCLHVTSRSRCLSKSLSKLNMVSMVMDTLMGKMGCTPILSSNILAVKEKRPDKGVTVRVLLYWCESKRWIDIASRWDHGGLNLMFSLSSDKNQRIYTFSFPIVQCKWILKKKFLCLTFLSALPVPSLCS